MKKPQCHMTIEELEKEFPHLTDWGIKQKMKEEKMKKKCACKNLNPQSLIYLDKEGNCDVCGYPYDILGKHEQKFDLNRKHYPVHTGCFCYFPNALKYISHVSWVGNEQHNPGQPLHWDKNKSTDDADARARHILGEEVDVDGLLEEGKAAWRSLAVLEKKLESLGFKI